jgi:ankyrin repeat protein
MSPLGDKTALEVACQKREWKLVCALANAGANVNTKFQGKPSVFPMAQTILISNAMYPEKMDDIRVALHAACHFNAKEMVYFLLDKGADPNVVGQYLVCFSGLLPL